MSAPNLRTLLSAGPVAAALLLSACGGGGSTAGTAGTATDTTSDGGSTTGVLTLGVTDMPVDDAIEVNVVFTGVSVKPADGEALVYTCADPEFDCGEGDSRSIDLLALTGEDSETLLDGVTVPGGDYEWIRLQVDAAQPRPGSEGASNIVLESNPEGSEVLAIPSGTQSGLKLVSGFSVPAGGAADFTIDFDLRRAVTKLGRPQAPEYLLKPALRLVDNNAAGTLAGTFEPGLYGDCTAPANAAVYVYEGGNATTGDIGSEDEPLASMSVSDDDGDGIDEPEDTDGVHEFEFGFLDAEPDYTVAVTCQADLDGEEGGDEIDFVDSVNEVMIEPRETTTVTFDGTS